MITLSEFDTDYTLLYKNAYHLEIPTKYIVLQDGSYQSVISIIERDIYQMDMYSIWISLSEYQLNFSSIDFCYLYFYISNRLKIRPGESLEKINNYISFLNNDATSELYQINEHFKEFTSLSSLQEATNFWFQRYETEKEKETSIYENIIKIQKRLEETEATPIEGLTIDSHTVEYETVFEGRVPTIYDGISIFDSIACSEYIPYIQWNDKNETKYYKVYENENFTNYEVILQQQFRKINTLYFLMLVEEPGKTLTKKSYTTCSYYLDTNKFKFSVPIAHKQTVLSRILHYLSKVQFRNGKETNLKGSFHIPNLQVDPAALHFLLLNDDNPDSELSSILSTYLYIDERKTSIINSEKIRIRYKTIESQEEEEFEGDDQEGETPSAGMLSLEEGHEEISIVRIKSKEILDRFLKIFSRLMTIYSESIEFTNDFIDSAVPKEFFKEKKETKKETKLNLLRDVAPDVFSSGAKGYARKCIQKKQPIIVKTEEEKEEWRNRTFLKGEDEYYRQIGQFPPGIEDPMFHFVCPTEENPYPTLIRNSETGKEKYPYVPCCAAEDNINDPKSYYNNYNKSLDGIKEAGTSKGYKINTIKVLSYGTKGVLPIQIQDLLASVNPDQKFEFERFGVGRSPNSLLHCILTAVNDIRYMEKNQNEKELYCHTIRREMIHKFQDMGIYKQELFDINDSEIKHILEDTNSFLDPAQFYRGLEELFNLNIFVIFKGNEENSEPQFELPRHRLVHIRPDRNERLSVIIFKHLGGEAEDLQYPQCELIINTGKEKKTEEGTSVKKGKGRPKKTEKTESKAEYLFSLDMTELLYKSFYNSTYNYMFHISSQEKVETRLQPYSKINWEDVFEKPLQIAFQSIDNYGKCRSITLKLDYLYITLFIPPSQPLKVPVKKDIYYSQEEVIRKIFGTPMKETSDGLWYSILGFEYGFYVPCLTSSKSLKPIPVQLQFAKEMNRKPNPIEQYRNMKKYSKILLDMIIWGLRSNGILNRKDFLEKFTKFVEIDTSIPTDTLPNVVYRKLPDVGNFNSLHGIWPEYFTSSNTIRLPPSLYEKIYSYLKRYYTDTDGLSLPPNPYLNNVFEYEWDFSPHLNTRVLISSNHFDSWYNYYKNKKLSGNIIQESIDDELLLSTKEPIFFKDVRTNKIYIIQNVFGREKEKALFVSNHWKNTKFNYGYNSPPADEMVLAKPYVVYNITYTKQLEMKYAENISSDSTNNYLQILVFGTNYYAALLPLL